MSARNLVREWDEHISVETVSTVLETVEAPPETDLFAYEGAAHGFFNRVRIGVYDATATRTTFDRAMAGLRAAR